IAGAGVLGIGVIEALQVPAAISGEGGDGVAALGYQLPQVFWRADVAGVAAGHADDRDRLGRTNTKVHVLALEPVTLLERRTKSLYHLTIARAHGTPSPRDSVDRPSALFRRRSSTPIESMRSLSSGSMSASSLD